MSFETIKFEIFLRSEFELNPPHATLYIDSQKVFSDFIVKDTCVSFTETLSFGQHELQLARTNTEKNQLLYIDRVIIDGVDIRDILWVSSYNVPEYPEPWATIQRKTGTNLEDQIIGETCLGHNSQWHLPFTSPFYRYVMKWMKSYG